MVKLLVFLGNPGREYARTRHNVGWMVADQLHPISPWTEKFNGLTSQREGYRLLKPQTYMNESGRSVRACLDYYNLKPQEILVVHDDLELPYGTLKMQQGGGLQGHNGLKSINTHLGSDQFLRLRIGIGRPKRGSVASFVLERFSQEEECVLGLVLSQAESMLRDSKDALPVTNIVI